MYQNYFRARPHLSKMNLVQSIMFAEIRCRVTYVVIHQILVIGKVLQNTLPKNPRPRSGSLQRLKLL
jgi:hypothetical protein